MFLGNDRSRILHFYGHRFLRLRVANYFPYLRYVLHNIVVYLIIYLPPLSFIFNFLLYRSFILYNFSYHRTPLFVLSHLHSYVRTFLCRTTLERTTGLKPVWDFATTFKIIVDDFLLRYLATDVITLELNMVTLTLINAFDGSSLKFCLHVVHVLFHLSIVFYLSSSLPLSSVFILPHHHPSPLSLPPSLSSFPLPSPTFPSSRRVKETSLCWLGAGSL